MKKIISICLCFIIFISLSVPFSATVEVACDTKELKPLLLQDGTVEAKAGKELCISTISIDGNKIENAIYIQGADTATCNIVFKSGDAVFGKQHARPLEQGVVTEGASIKVTPQAVFENGGASVYSGYVPVDFGKGVFNTASGITVSFYNTEDRDIYSSYTLTIFGSDGMQKTLNLIIKSLSHSSDATRQIIDVGESEKTQSVWRMVLWILLAILCVAGLIFGVLFLRKKKLKADRK